MSERKFVVVDGSSLLSTCYYAVLPREIMLAKTDKEKEEHYGKILHTSNGTYTSGITGVLKAVTSLLKKQQPAYVALVFDETGDIFHREPYPDYRGTRSRTPEPLKQQFVLIGRVLEETDLKVLYDDRYEAGGYAGNLVYKFRGQVSMVVMTKDHDYLQLINDECDVRAWMVQAGQGRVEELCDKHYGLYGLNKAPVNLSEKIFEFTTETVYSEEEAWPRQTTNLKEIQGDTSDSIPGARGVASTTSFLLGEYGTVEHIYEVIHEAKQDKEQLKELQDF